MNFENETNYESDYYEAVYRIIEDPFDCNDVYECISKIEEQLEIMVSKDDIRDYRIFTDIMRDSDKSKPHQYYISIAWVDRNNVLDVCGTRITFNA